MYVYVHPTACLVSGMTVCVCYGVDCIQSAWLDVSRTGPPTEQFSQGDGFFLYVDGARHLPDNVTVSRVRL